METVESLTKSWYLHSYYTDDKNSSYRGKVQSKKSWKQTLHHKNNI